MVVLWLVRGGGMGIDEAHVHTEQGHEVFLRQHLVGRTFREDMPLEADDVRGVVEDHAEIMADHKLRESLGGAQFVQQFAEQMLSLKIHPGRGLVEHEQFRFLLQGKRQQDALHFAAGQIAKPPGSEVFRLDH